MKSKGQNMPGVRCVLLCGKDLVFTETATCLELPDAEACNGMSLSWEFEFALGGYLYKCAHIEDKEHVSAPLRLLPLREAFPRLEEADYKAGAKAMELLQWTAATRYCGVCGEPLVRTGEISKQCPGCGKEYFPQLSPAIIVLVRRGKEALLVHARTFSRPFFGLVAGFVETGETLEECVAREVMEETSLSVKNIRYFGSQSWLYPATLMLGFTADYAGGELRFADGELTEGGFFDAEHLPLLPTPPSIARRMIDDWLNNK